MQADVGAIKVKALEVAREAETRVTPDDDEIFIQTENALRKVSLTLVFAMRVGNAQREVSGRHSASISGKGPVGIAVVQFFEAKI